MTAPLIDQIFAMDEAGKNEWLTTMRAERNALPEAPRVIWAANMYAAQGVKFTAEQKQALAAVIEWRRKYFGDEHCHINLEIRDPRDKSLLGYMTYTG